MRSRWECLPWHYSPKLSDMMMMMIFMLSRLNSNILPSQNVFIHLLSIKIRASSGSFYQCCNTVPRKRNPNLGANTPTFCPFLCEGDQVLSSRLIPFPFLLLTRRLSSSHQLFVSFVSDVVQLQYSILGRN